MFERQTYGTPLSSREVFKSRRKDLRVGTSRGAFASVGETGVFLSTHTVNFPSFLNRPSGMVNCLFFGRRDFLFRSRVIKAINFKNFSMSDIG